MTTVPHEPSTLARRTSWLDARDMWTSLAISVIWLAVLVTAIFGPDIESTDYVGSSATVPSAVVVALFAVFATWAVAKYGFGTKTKDD